jgi:Tuberculosis necrotizing toxin
MSEFRRSGEAAQLSEQTRSRETGDAAQRYRLKNGYERRIAKAGSFRQWIEPLRDLKRQRAALWANHDTGSPELAGLDAAIEEMEAKRDASRQQSQADSTRERLVPLTAADAAAFDAEVGANLAKLRADTRLDGFFPPTYDPYYGRTPSQYLAHFARGRTDRGGISWEFEREAPGDGIQWGNEVARRLQAGERYSRFSHAVEPAQDRGSYLTITGTGYEAAGLHPGALAQYQEYVVRRPIQAFRSEVLAGSFNTRGRGGQIRLELPVSWYVQHGYLEPVRPAYRPTG